MYKAQTRGGAHPTGLEQVPIVMCKDCDLPVESVAQLGARLVGTRPNRWPLQIPLWFQASTHCAHCKAKPPFLDVKLADLEDDTLIRERISVRGVHWAMHACTHTRMDECCRELSDFNDPALDDLMRRMKGLAKDRYAGAKGKNANAALVTKLHTVLNKVDAIIARVPTKARIDIECVDGTYSTSLYVLTAVLRVPPPAAP